MALDCLAYICRPAAFMPPYVRETYDGECETLLSSIFEYLDGDLNRLSWNHGALMHLTRLLTALPSDYPKEYHKRQKLLERLWALGTQGVKRVRIADALSNQLVHIRVNLLPPIWMQRNAKSSHISEEDANHLGNIVKWDVLFQSIKERFERNYCSSIGTSSGRRKVHLAACVRLAAASRSFWDSEHVGSSLRHELNLDNMDYSETNVFFKTRIMLLFVGNKFWHQMCMSGDLFSWWSPLSNRTSSTWDAVFSTCLFRAAKYGWATGIPITQACQTIRPFLFQWVASAIGLAPPSRATFHRDNVPGEYTPLLNRSVNLLKKLAETLVLMLEPAEHRSSSGELSTLNLFQAFVSTAFPYSHPSHSGKWSNNLASFIKAFVQGYLRRVGRERMSQHVVKSTVGWDTTVVPHEDLRLGRSDDTRFVQLILPMLLQGTHARSLNAATAYESSLKYVAHLCPELVLDPVLDRIFPALETVTESHQLQSALRLLSPFAPLILQHHPGVLPQFLTLTCPGIDSADPFKTIQVLTFYSVLLSQLPCCDFSDIDVDSLPINTVSEEIRRAFFPNPEEASGLVTFYNYPNREDIKKALGYWSPKALRERLSALLISTSSFPAWASTFFDMVLNVVSNSTTAEKSSASYMNSVDQSFGTVLQFTLACLIARCDDSIARDLCSQLISWLTNRISPDNRKSAMLLVHVFAYWRADICLEPLFNLIYAKLPHSSDLSELKLGSTEEASVLWYLGCFTSLLRCDAKHLIPLEEKIVRVLLWSLLHTNPRVYALGGKAARRAVESALRVGLRLPLPGASDPVQTIMNAFWMPIAWWSYEGGHDAQGLSCFWVLPDSETIAFGNRVLALAFTVVVRTLASCLPFPLEIASWRPTTKGGNFIEDFLQCLSSHYHLMDEVQFSSSLTGQSYTKLITRALSLSRYLLKSLSTLFPDERPRVTSGIPTISPVDHALSLDVVHFVAKLCISLCETYLGLKVIPEEDRVVQIEPCTQLRGTEDFLITKKLLRTMDQLLIRTAPGTILKVFRGETGRWTVLNSWLSVCAGIHSTSDAQDCGRTLWEQHIVQVWETRLESRHLGQKLTGFRLILMLLAGHLSTQYYAENRRLAQDLIRGASTYHYAARSRLVKIYVTYVNDIVNQVCLATIPLVSMMHRILNYETNKVLEGSYRRLRKVASSEAKNVDSSLSADESLKDAVSVQSDLPAEDTLELCYARISGVTFSLDNIPMLRRIWSSADTVAVTLLALAQAFKAPIDKDTVRTRLIKLAQSILNYREELPRDEQFENSVMKGLLLPLLQELTGVPVHHWRFQVLATAILAIFNDIPNRSIEEEYVLWLIRACDRTLHYPLLNTLAVFALTLYVAYKLSHGTETIPESVASALQGTTFTHKVVNVLIHANHESCSPVAGQAPETAGQLVVSVIKVDLTWPTLRGSRQSVHLSLHNCLTVQTLAQFQVYAARTASKDYLEPYGLWSKEAKRLLDQPAGDTESHVAACEILAGLIRVMNTERSEESRCRVWNCLHPQVLKAYNILDHERYTEFLDAILFGIDRFSGDCQDSQLAPFISFVADPTRQSGSTDGCPNTLIFGSSSSLEATKRLKLLRLLYRVYPHSERLPSMLLPSLPFLIEHPYDQIRQETAACLAAVLFLLKLSSGLRSTLTDVLRHIVFKAKDFVVTSAGEEMRRALKDQRPTELCAAETMMLTVIALFRAHQERNAYDQVASALPLLFEGIKHPDVDVIAATALEYVCSGPPSFHQEETGMMQHQEFICSVVDELSMQRVSSSWRVRLVCMRLSEVLANRLRLVLHGSDIFKRLIDLSVKSLTDPQSEVRHAARRCLTNLLVSLSTNACQSYIKDFTAFSGSPRHSSSSDIMAKVLGLAAIVQSAPYHVPEWLPGAITQLAKCGHAKATDAVKREVQQSLQEFFRTHQDAWTQIHSKKFSDTQLDVLETYRGRPIYFG